MARQSWVQVGGVLYEKGTEPVTESAQFPTVMGDLPDFVSPIDGTVVRGRAGMREHCKRHDVVPTADLQGLPVKKVSGNYVPDRTAIRETIRKQLYKG